MNVALPPFRKDVHMKKTISQDCVVAVYDSFDKARTGIWELEKAEFPPDQVSLVTHDVRHELPRGEALQHGDNAERNAARGAGFGGLLGLLIGAPLLAIPGVGPVLLAGPLAAGMTGAIVGGFLGSMSGWGVHADHIREYEQLVHQGSVLVVANGDPVQLAEAKRILDGTPAREVHVHAEEAADSPEVDDRPPL
jgi:hypothetical protein